jgi:hypothetical protein
MLNVNVVGRLVVGIGACALVAAASSPAKPANAATDEQELRIFLRAWEGDTPDAREVSYKRAWVDLRGDGGRQAIVYVQDRCGSGGCTLLVLEHDGRTFRIVGEITITRPPIQILSHVTNGWHDIGVFVAGGGTPDRYQAGVPFEGKQYALNPTVPPARNAKGERVKATVITRNDPSLPLFDK